jgi:integrase
MNMNTDDRREVIEVHIDRRGRQGGRRKGWRVWWRDRAGVKHTRERGCRRRADALRQAQRIRVQVNRHGLLWADFETRYLAEQKRRCKPGTVACARGTLRAFSGAMGIDRLEDVTRETVVAYLAIRCDDGLRPATANKHRAMLRAAFEWAIDESIYLMPKGDRLRERNPCDGIRRMKETPLAHVIYERRSECARLADALREDGERWEAAALLGMDCGLRVSEAANVLWRSVDLERREIVIQAEPNGWSPKGLGGRLRLSERLAAVLAALRAEAVHKGGDLAARRVLGGESPAYFVRAFRRRLRAACRRAALPEILPHGLRRSFVTVLANEGLAAPALQCVARHTDIKTTLRFYAKVDARRAADDAMSRLEGAQ